MKSVFLKIKENYLLLLILLLATFLRFFHVNYQSIWLDEIHTMIETDPKLPFSDFINLLLFREQLQHLYFVLVRFLNMIFGHDTSTVRNFSAFLGVLGVYSVYLLGKALNNKRLGYIFALLLTVNYFHIWYSQEARPYSFFFLFTVLSFYKLVQFVRLPSTKNAFYFGLFTALMLYGHFFALFILFAQGIVLLYFLISRPKEQQKKFFTSCLIFGITTFVLWIPSIKVFLLVANLKSFWVQPPTLDVYTQLFKEFFGHSEMVVFIVVTISIFYVIKLFNQNDNKNTLNNKYLFSAIFIFPWIVIGLLFPLIRSYTSLPMIISRYFIGVLPAILLILAIGINAIKNKIMLVIVLTSFVAFSLTDIIFVKDYYFKVSKTQYREMAQEIINKNAKKDEIVSAWGWHYGFFLNNPKNQVVEKSLQKYIDELILNPDLAKSFWYVDAQYNKYEISREAEDFLTNNFDIQENIELYDTWAKYYVKKQTTKLELQTTVAEWSLSDITDEYWVKGIGKGNNTLLFQFSDARIAKLRNAKKLKFTNGQNATIKSFQQQGNYIYVVTIENSSEYQNVASFPNKIEVQE